MDNAFKFIEKNGGLCKESDYPYTSGGGTTGSCKSDCSVVSGSAVTGYKDVSPVPQVTPPVSLRWKAVAQQPISIAIEADQMSFQFYSGGVMTGTCGTTLDHGVLAVGYGTQDGKDYWKVKNSWGASWGPGRLHPSREGQEPARWTMRHSPFCFVPRALNMNDAANKQSTIERGFPMRLGTSNCCAPSRVI